MISRPISLLLIAAFSTVITAAPSPELVVLQTQYEHAVAQRVIAPFDAGLAELNTKYAAGLDRAMADAKAAGKLEDILAIEAEKKRLASNLPIPATDDAAEPEALKKFRAIYRLNHAALTATREKSQANLLPPYTTKLKDLEALLVKTDRVDEAKEVLAYRQSLGQGSPLSPMSGSPGPAVAKVPPIPAQGTERTALMPPAATPKTKGDDRKAAEWVLANWSEHRLWITNGSDLVVKGAADLPKGRFEITSISIDGRYFTGSTLDGAALLQNLGGLGRVQSLAISSFENLKDEDIAFTATLPALQTLSLIKVPQLTDAVLAHLHGLRSLKKLEISEAPGITGATLNRWVDSPVEDMKLWKCGITDANVSHLVAFRKLQTLNIGAQKSVTDASLPHLRSLPALSRLYISATGITPAGLASTPMPRIESLDCHSLSGLGMKELIPQVAPAFPNLSGYQLSYDIKTPEDLAALAHFKKLERLTNYGNVHDAAWPGLLELRGLLSFGHSSKTKPLPDVALQTFAQLKRFKTLWLGEAKPSEAGLAALRKARPDIKINN